MTVDELYAKAQAALDRGDLEAAAEGFERVVRVDPEGPLAPGAWLRAAEARDLRGELDASVSRLEQLVRRFPAHQLAREARVRLARLYCYQDEWERAGRVASQLLPEVDELGPLERVVVYAAKALALVALEDPDGAIYFVEKGRNVVDAYELDRAGALPRDLAPLYFALGEVRRLRAERIGFVPPPPGFAALLEERCQLLLDAQSAYSDAMRAYDAHWSAVAGYRVGELYQSLHRDLMAVPPPASADTEARRQLFEGAMRLRYSILLEKAAAMLDHTLRMAERTEEHSAWVERTRAARTEIDRAIARENAALDALPVSRADLQAALDDLGRRASPPPARAP